MLSNVRAVKIWHFWHSLTMLCVIYELKCLCYWIATTISFPTIPNLLHLLKISEKYKQKCKVWTFKLAKIWTFFQFFRNKSAKSYSFVMFYTSLERYFITLCNKRREKITKFSYSRLRYHLMVSKTQKIISCKFSTKLHYTSTFFDRNLKIINI